MCSSGRPRGSPKCLALPQPRSATPTRCRGPGRRLRRAARDACTLDAPTRPQGSQAAPGRAANASGAGARESHTARWKNGSARQTPRCPATRRSWSPPRDPPQGQPPRTTPPPAGKDAPPPPSPGRRRHRHPPRARATRSPETAAVAGMVVTSTSSLRTASPGKGSPGRQPGGTRPDFRGSLPVSRMLTPGARADGSLPCIAPRPSPTCPGTGSGWSSTASPTEATASVASTTSSSSPPSPPRARRSKSNSPR